MEFGPLLRVWTLRFESKHTYFKRCIRNLKNFKNLTLSLSEKHELYQCLLRLGAGLRNLQIVKNETELRIHVYCHNIQKAICEQGLNIDTMECNSVLIKGTSYKRGDVVVLRQEPYQYNVEFGKICMILYDFQEKISFVLEILETTFNPHLRVYELGSIIRYECVFVEELLSYEPLHIYFLNTVQLVRLKHGIVKSV